jgi:DNA-binding CsgD family transcriptional regulator
MNNAEIRDSFLYVISWESTPEVVKIGRTTNISQRFNQFLTAHHDPLMVRCLCPEDICSEDTMHRQFDSARKTLEHFELTEDLQAKIDLLNMSNSFTPYLIPRTRFQTGLMEDLTEVEAFKDNMGVPPLRVSRIECDVTILAAIGMTVYESADVLSLSESAVKSHRSGVIQKTFTPNLVSAVSKLFVHDIISPKELVNS